jgi:iron-sulfur cluster repair protein YtfE (RIC family)
MLTRIGKQPRDRDDHVVAALHACHQRIRDFCALAARLASEAPASPSEVASAAEMVARYFTVALPLHVADEDLTLRPALLQHGEARELGAALDAMAAEHRLIDEVLDALLPRWSRLAIEPALRPSLGGELQRDTEQLRELFDGHLSREEATIFPAVARLGAADLAAIGAAMRLRRAWPASTPTTPG